MLRTVPPSGSSTGARPRGSARSTITLGLEALAGKTRRQLDFVFLLSSMSPELRMSICAHSHLPEHATPTSSAHVVPAADFLEKVAQQYGDPNSKGFEQPARTPPARVGDLTASEKLAARALKGRSPSVSRRSSSRSPSSERRPGRSPSAESITPSRERLAQQIALSLAQSPRWCRARAGDRA